MWKNRPKVKQVRGNEGVNSPSPDPPHALQHRHGLSSDTSREEVYRFLKQQLTWATLPGDDRSPSSDSWM